MANWQDNPFEFAYDGALTVNVPGKVNVRKVHYLSNGVEVTANLYTPAGYDETADKTYAADAIANVVLYAISQPDSVDVSDIIVRPSAEA